MADNLPVNNSPIVACIGLDWAKDQHAICLQAADSSRIETSVLEHKPETLHAWVSQLQARFPIGRVAIALEQSRGAVIHALMTYDFLVLYPIPPASLAAYRKALHPSGAKDDPNDARLLLELVSKNREHFRAWIPQDPLTRQLQLLTQYRRQLVDQRTALTNQLTELLKGYFPQALDWAGGLNTLQACDFLQKWPTLQAVQKTSKVRLRKFYHRHGCRNTEQIEKRLQQMAQAQPLTSDRVIIESNSLMVLAWVPQLMEVIPSISTLDQKIKTLFAQHPDSALFDSPPGAGPALAPRLLAAFGTDRSRFQTAQEVEQFSGIAPVIERSGKSVWIHRRFACSKFLRQTFHEFAGASIHHCDWAQAVYLQQRSRGKKHHVAIRAVAYKWIRILFRCWQNRTLYDESIYLQSLHRRNPQLLAMLPATS
jgi:transposase